ncbi:nuclear speckle splicing regulatory protein 1-like [Nylanderia fulva]|uniref:nuclear speckle splicing regulatory protein 1-like n=1 Tax=Nylanderia fulva TaxID=613905 RepID=UPI0010FB8A61|nr:nuclear speckle splicing regulatory protein 1-like [Nylanderia fulva]
MNDGTQQYEEKFCCVEAEHFDRLLKKWLSLHMSQNTSKLKSINPTKVEYKINYLDESILQEDDSPRVDNTTNVKPQLVFTTENDTATLEDHYRNHINSRSRTYSNTWKKLHDRRQRNILNAPEEVDSRKAKRFEMGQRAGIATDQSEANNNNDSLRHKNARTPASEARSAEDHIRNTGAETEKIREERDNNPYQRKLDEVEDKDRQDRRSTQRDVQEETNRSWIVAGKTRKDEDTAEESSENSGENPYQHRRETRLLDNGKIGRLDRFEERSPSTETSGNPAKRPEEGNRHENEENPTARGRKKEGEDKDKKEGTMLLNKNKESGSRKATVSLDNAKEGRLAVNEEGKLPTNGEQRKAASTERRYDPEEAGKWRVNSKCLQIFL